VRRTRPRARLFATLPVERVRAARRPRVRRRRRNGYRFLRTLRAHGGFTMKLIRNVSLCSLAVFTMACSGGGGGAEKIDIGNRNVAAIGEQLSDFAGSWDGYAEAYEFEAGSDRIR